MPLAFPDDPNTYDKDLQFMLGDSLLVAPIYDESDERSVYLPAGQWIDYWTGAEQVGGRNIRVTCPLEQMPIYVKAGAIIPTMPDARRVPDGLISPLIVEVYPHGNGDYTPLRGRRRNPFQLSRKRAELPFRVEKQH